MPFAPHVVYYFYGKRPRGAKTQEMRECFVNGCTPFLSRRTLWGAVVAALALMVLGSLVDYPLSSALYDASNPFAIFFAAYGAIPAPLGCVAAGTLFLCGRSGARSVAGVLQAAGGVLLLVVGVGLVCFLPALYLPVSPVVPAAAGLVLCLVTVLLTRRLAKGADPNRIARVALAILLVILCQLAVVNLIKVFWGRPRMRLVVSHPEAYFFPWWRRGAALKGPLLAAGVGADEFKSFPFRPHRQRRHHAAVGAGPLPQTPAGALPAGAGGLRVWLDRRGGPLPHHAGRPLSDRHGGGLPHRVFERLFHLRRALPAAGQRVISFLYTKRPAEPFCGGSVGLFCCSVYCAPISCSTGSRASSTGL